MDYGEKIELTDAILTHLMGYSYHQSIRVDMDENEKDEWDSFESFVHDEMRRLPGRDEQARLDVMERTFDCYAPFLKERSNEDVNPAEYRFKNLTDLVEELKMR